MTLVITCGSWSLWHAFETRDARVIDVTFKEQGSVVGLKVSRHMNEAVIAIQRMADRWTAQGGIPYDYWKADAQNYIIDFPAMKAMTITGSDMRVKWIEPIKGNESAIDLYLAFDENRTTALMKAIELNTPTITPPIDLVQGYRGVVMLVPVYVEDKFDGFVTAIFDPTVFWIQDSLLNLLKTLNS